MKSTKLLLPLLLVLLALSCQRPAANNSSAPPAAGSGQTSSTQRPPAPENRKAPMAPADEIGDDTEADFGGTAGITEKKKALSGAALLTAVRAGQHEKFDRIVFEFAGDELPGYRVEYIDKPVRQCGSGNAVPMAGDGWLEIRFSPANAHTEQGEPTVKTREMAPDHKIVKELKSTCDFEADVAWVAGVSSPNKYRVLELKNPPRVAVDIKH